MTSTIDQFTRRPITLPDGRIIFGKIPGHSGGRLVEHQLRDELARQLRGVTEAVLPYGRADVMTTDRVFEVEPASQWRHGVRQALAYYAQCGLLPAVALFGEAHSTQVLRIYLKLRDGAPAIELWWYAPGRWDRISSRAACRNQVAPDHKAA